MRYLALNLLMIGGGLFLASRQTAQPGQAQNVPFLAPKSITENWSYSDMYSQIRGLRNNNPGNIRIGANWQGMAANQSDPAFVVFESPEWGIRAMGRVLLNYQRLYGLNTVKGIIDRWAPPNENNTAAYQQHVAELIGVAVDEPFQLQPNLLQLVKAIIKHENGIQPYSDALIQDGLARV